MSKRPAYSAYAPAAKVPRTDLSSTTETVQQYEQRGMLDASKLDEAVLADLHCLGPAGVARALDQFCKHDLQGVENHAGLLKDIIIAESEALMNEGPPEPAVGAVNGRPAKEAATPDDAAAIISLLRDYHTAGSLDMDKFDAPVRRDLESLPYAHAAQVLQVYVDSDRATVTNHSSFLKSIIKLARNDPHFGERGSQLDPVVSDKLDEAIAGGYISPTECDALLRASIGVLPPADALNVLNMFIDIISAGQDTVHNRPAFLAGMLKRYRQSTDTSGHPAKPVPELVEEYCGSGRIPRDVVEPLLRDLQMLPPGGAGQVLEEFVHADHSNIRNPTGYLKGIIRKIFGGAGHAPTMSSRPLPPAAAGYRPARPPADDAVLGVLAGYRDAGMIADGDLDHGCVLELQRLGVAKAQQVLEDFFQHDIYSLQNKSSYLMGIIKRSGVKDTQMSAPPVVPSYQSYQGGKSQGYPRSSAGYGAQRPMDGSLAGSRYGEGYQSRAPPPPYGQPQPSIAYRQSSGYGEPQGKGKGYGKGGGKGKGGYGGYTAGNAEAAIAVRPKPHVGAANEADVFCPSCGVQQPPVNFCVKCGFSLNRFVEGVLGRQ